MRVEPSLMHPEGGSWTRVRTHTPSKFSKVLHEPLAPIPLDRSKFRENGSQPPPNRTGGRVGHQRVALTGTFPMAPLQTARESFDLKPLSSGLVRASLAS